MTGCDCRAGDPLKGMTYAQASSTATRLYVQGWRQSRCKDCRLFTEWKRRGVRWAAETAAAGSP
jgi:hypothetical protein